MVLEQKRDSQSDNNNDNKRNNNNYLISNDDDHLIFEEHGHPLTDEWCKISYQNTWSIEEKDHADLAPRERVCV